MPPDPELAHINYLRAQGRKPELLVRSALVLFADEAAAVPGVQLSGLQGKCSNTMQRERLWLFREAGATFDYSFITHFSKLRIRAVQVGRGGDAGNDYADAYGEGLWETGFMWDVVRGELGWKSETDDGRDVYRWQFFVPRAGGWAGGRATVGNPHHPNLDVGSCIIGGWQLITQITKQPHPYGREISIANGWGDPADLPIPHDHPINADMGAASHEALHMFDIPCHAGALCRDWSTVPASNYPLDLGDHPHPMKRHLTPGQRAQFLEQNARFVA